MQPFYKLKVAALKKRWNIRPDWLVPNHKAAAALNEEEVERFIGKRKTANDN